jgi:hypothetical protein
MSTEIDLTRPNEGRIIDCWLGGTHNFEIDRLAAGRLASHAPPLVQELKTERKQLVRVVTYMVKEKGLRHFLDFGSGLPTCGNTHETALAIEPAVKVIYSDIDRVTVAYGQQILRDTPHVRYLWCDAADVRTLLQSRDLEEHFGGERRVGIVFMGLGHILSDEALAGALHTLYEWAGEGSYMLYTDTSGETWNTEPILIEANRMAAQSGLKKYYHRTKEELLRLLSPWKLTEHGVADNAQWGLAPWNADSTGLANNEVTPGLLIGHSMVLYK